MRICRRKCGWVVDLKYVLYFYSTSEYGRDAWKSRSHVINLPSKPYQSKPWTRSQWNASSVLTILSSDSFLFSGPFHLPQKGHRLYLLHHQHWRLIADLSRSFLLMHLRKLMPRLTDAALTVGAAMSSDYPRATYVGAESMKQWSSCRLGCGKFGVS